MRVRESESERERERERKKKRERERESERDGWDHTYNIIVKETLFYCSIDLSIILYILLFIYILQ